MHDEVPTTRTCIHLRRPAVLNLQDLPFLPAVGQRNEIETRWQARCQANPALHDGRICHVLGVHRNGYGGATIHVADCAYRFHAVQSESFDLGVRSLGVKGLIEYEGSVLLGRRAESVGAYPGLWEFAPAGCVEPGRNPEDVVLAELGEETELKPASAPQARAVLYDSTLRCWEIVYRLKVISDESPTRTAEYDEFKWCRPPEFPSGLSPIAHQIARRLMP